METTNEYLLRKEIIARSVATQWEEAREEWDLKAIFHQTEPARCLCGHTPILELCVLQNRKNGTEAIVGNVCVKKFMGLPSDRVFQAVRRVTNDATKPLNEEAIEHAHRSGWITDWERDFSKNTMSRRKMSDKQEIIRIQINEKVKARVNRNRSDAQ
jgi:hypothetical protein